MGSDSIGLTRLDGWQFGAFDLPSLTPLINSQDTSE